MSTKRRAERRGRRAEDFAALWLFVKGYRVLARRARTPRGEIDIIAARGRLIAFIEVKWRANGVAMISERQKSRIAGAAEAWLAVRGDLNASTMRFDAFFIDGPFRWRHVRDAWRA